MPKLLIVEDDKDLNTSVCEYFKANGYETESCQNGIDGGVLGLCLSFLHLQCPE